MPKVTRASERKGDAVINTETGEETEIAEDPLRPVFAPLMVSELSGKKCEYRKVRTMPRRRIPTAPPHPPALLRSLLQRRRQRLWWRVLVHAALGHRHLGEHHRFVALRPPPKMRHCHFRHGRGGAGVPRHLVKATPFPPPRVGLFPSVPRHGQRQRGGAAAFPAPSSRNRAPSLCNLSSYEYTSSLPASTPESLILARGKRPARPVPRPAPATLAPPRRLPRIHSH